jgi:hypothetical protein
MSYARAALDLAVTALANSAAFQSLCGAADATAALSFIVKTTSGGPSANDALTSIGKAADGSDIDLSAPGFAIVGTQGVTKTPGGVGYDDRDLSISYRIVMPRVVGAEAPAAASDRCWDTAGDIADEIDAQRGSATGFADAESNVDGLYQDEEGVHRLHSIAEITTNVRG